jgi:hypothetical protein
MARKVPEQEAGTGSLSRSNTAAAPPDATVSHKVSLTKPSAFSYGLIALGIGLFIALFVPEPTKFQIAIFASVIGLGGAGITSGITGVLEIETKWLSAGGPLAVFIFLCVFIVKVSSPEVGIFGHPDHVPRIPPGMTR